MVFDNWFGKRQKRKKITVVDPGIPFGRYSDNNKSVDKVNRWNEAEELFKEDKYVESLDAFFQYLRDDQQGNAVFEKNGTGGSFQLYQGSKVVRGHFNEKEFQARVTLAAMPEPSIPVMRRLLEMNFHLHYCRYSLEDGVICMRFDTDIRTANPNKLYYGLKELATKADKQDDLLVHEFASLQPLDTEHVQDIPASEKEIKYEFMQKWLNKTLESVRELDPDKFAGGIAYLLLTVTFRIDYLISPEGKLMSQLEKIVEKYYRKDEKPTTERNQQMIEGLQKLRNKSREEVFPSMFRSRHSFSIVSPQNHKTIADTLNNAMQNMYWYRDNNYQAVANEVMEYGLAYCQFSYSLPKPLNDLYRLFMKINHADYFTALGFEPTLYQLAGNRFETDAITEEIESVLNTWKAKYPKLQFNTAKLRYESLVAFNQSYLNEIIQLNFES